VLPVADRGAAGAGCRAGQSMACFLLRTLNSGMATYRSNGDPETLAFLGFAYFNLVTLFYCEDAEPGSRLRHGMKIDEWLLITALTLLFSLQR
jgi:hypothetical protein